MDMVTSDTTKFISHGFIFQVNSSSNYEIYSFCIMSKITMHLFITCRYSEDLYKPRVKMRDQYNVRKNGEVDMYVYQTLCMYVDFPKLSSQSGGPWWGPYALLCNASTHEQETCMQLVLLKYMGTWPKAFWTALDSRGLRNTRHRCRQYQRLDPHGREAAQYFDASNK